MKKRSLLTAAALALSLGVVSCASNDRQERQEEIEDLKQEQQEIQEEKHELSEEFEQKQVEIDEVRQEHQEAESQPWADQQVSLDKVEKVQEKLNEEGYNAGPVDGLIGPKTKNALSSYQEKNDLDASGELTQETVDSMGLDFQIEGEAFAE